MFFEQEDVFFSDVCCRRLFRCLCQLLVLVLPVVVIEFRGLNALGDNFSLFVVAFLGYVLVATYFQDD